MRFSPVLFQSCSSYILTLLSSCSAGPFAHPFIFLFYIFLYLLFIFEQIGEDSAGAGGQEQEDGGAGRFS